MTDVQIEAGTLTASIADRVVSGLLLPFGEVGRTNLGRFSVDPGVIQIPNDVSVLMANESHKQTEPRARFLTATETSAGIVASFKVGENPECDELLAQIESGQATGKPKALSVEVKNIVLRAGKAVSGVLTGAAFVDRGAFPSAALMAADVGEDVTSHHDESEYIDVDGVKYQRVSDTETVHTADKTTSTTTVVEVTERPTEESDEQEGDTVGVATVPATLNAGKTTGKTEDTPITADNLFAMISEAVQTQEPTLMAALSDVKITGAGALGTTTVEPEYVGELWSGRTFQRKVIPNLQQKPLTSTKVIGYRYTQEPEVSEWAGNKAQIPSNAPTVEPYEVAFQRFAGGWDIAREFIDFGQTQIISELMQKAVNSYAKKSDNYTLAQLKAAATSAPVGTIPTGDDYVKDAGLVKLVRGAFRVIAQDALPSYAFVAPDVAENMALLKQNQVLAFLSLQLGLEEGKLENFKIIPHNGLGAGEVLVGAKEAVTVREIGGSPIRVNALDIAKGGYDEAVFGYVAVQIDYPTGLQLVTNAAP